MRFGSPIRPDGLLVVMTAPVSPWVLLRGQLAFLASEGYDVCLVSGPGELLVKTAEREGVSYQEVAIEREIKPLKDARAVLALVRLYRRQRPMTSMVSTPKAGLLAGLAALVTRVPVRVYTVRGLRMETEIGVRRALLWAMEWVSLRLASDVVFVSPSLRERARALRLIGDDRGVVLGHGASNGVDLKEFETTPERTDDAESARRVLGIAQDALVFGFVGRFTPDKGVEDLITAFEQVARTHPDVWLLIVGGDDGDAVDSAVHERVEQHPRIARTGWVPSAASYYQVLDVLVLPSRREGFPNVCLEAGAAGRPVIGMRATGVVDAVRDEVTGLLVDVGDVSALAGAMERLAADRGLVQRLGTNARQLVEERFSNEIVWGNLLQFLRRRRRAFYGRNPDGEGALAVAAGTEATGNPEVNGRRDG